MTGLIGALTGFATAIGVPFLIQLIKKRAWKAKKAKMLAFGVSAVVAVIWVFFSGAVPSPDVSGVAAFIGWLLGAVTVVYTSATLVYRWLEERVMKKVPSLFDIGK
jgi:uncharacterized membrane protein YkvI